MNISCEDTRRCLDSYLSNELPVETSQEVLRHLETCPQCAAELSARVRVRAGLRAAVRRTPVPAGLEARIRQAWRARPVFRWYPLATAAAVVVVCLAILGLWRLRADPEDAILREASTRLSAVLNVGLRDHLRCAVFRKYSKQPESSAQMAADLGPQFAGLVPLVQAKLPAGFQIIQGHLCKYGDRPYVHLIVTSGNKLLSVILTRKRPGESMNAGIAQGGVDRFQVVGFESRDYLIYAVSDLDTQQSLQLAANMAPAVRAYLAAREG